MYQSHHDCLFLGVLASSLQKTYLMDYRPICIPTMHRLSFLPPCVQATEPTMGAGILTSTMLNTYGSEKPVSPAGPNPVLQRTLACGYLDSILCKLVVLPSGG